MAYYAPYQSQYYTQIQAQNPVHIQQPAQVQQNNNGLIWIQGGENTAKSFMVAPNTTVVLFDSELPVFFLKSADASGMPLPLRKFEYTETTQAAKVKEENEQAVDFSAFATKTEFDAFRNEIQGMLKAVPKQTTRKKEAEEDG